eukprot:GFYU01019247.1.p2 GENE.GFYU01019247.1~~GFYU01019247.1.p2  ORF type:complete len:139 (+),score=31.53 GFYU01019247.1:22-417(+)
METNSCVEGLPCDDYKQMLYSKALYIGCARTSCGKKNLWICNFYPPIEDNVIFSAAPHAVGSINNPRLRPSEDVNASPSPVSTLLGEHIVGVVASVMAAAGVVTALTLLYKRKQESVAAGIAAAPAGTVNV